ncbi:hypothetical protein NJT12_24200 [Flavobacterium sp. AC]|uniref:Uncharacterized protein n=1 Tax=Flavobacterium azizsancarii TaxID=2961580 RepID=A0ABT4WLH7_9FLAO|nr:hypothetical protein [Flavobacterium azizsancarii]MDA6072729.1 hypothetical protein [Flavobacterium azizsancarii]
MKILAYLFLIAIILRPAFPVLNYIVNYDYIAKELCENKKQPQLGCNGKCHLKKELAKTTENDSPSSEKKNVSSGIDLLFIENIHAFNFNFAVKSILTNDILRHNLYSYFNIVLIFHPPAFQY